MIASCRPIFLVLVVTAAVATAFTPSSEPKLSKSASNGSIRYAPMKRVGLASARREFTTGCCCYFTLIHRLSIYIYKAS